MFKNKKNQKKFIVFAAGLLCVAMIAGTLAYYSSTASIDNVLKTQKYGNRTVENFTPEQNIEPGSQITKEVGVVNTGDYDLVVRIKMVETWSRGGTAFISHDSADAVFNTVARAGTSPNFTYTASQYDFNGAGSGPIDGKVFEAGPPAHKDESVMYKFLNLVTSGTGWEDGGDGYWYYNALLGAGQGTGNLLEFLVFADNADMGKYDVTEYYSITAASVIAPLQSAYDAAAAAYAATPTPANKTAMDAALAALDGSSGYNWTTTKPTNVSTITFVKSESAIDSDNGGYAQADYTLTIVTEVCQASTGAIDATWTAVAPPTGIRTKWGV